MSTALALARNASAVVPPQAIENGAVRLEGVGPDNPVLTGDGLVIPKTATDLKSCREEFFRVLAEPRVYHGE